jgi:hypothetical protein
MMLNIRIRFTDYAIIADFLNLDFCSEPFNLKGGGGMFFF